ncbi:hypothetical protein ACU4GI_33000 [Cupriavidus basilensis]
MTDTLLSLLSFPPVAIGVKTLLTVAALFFLGRALTAMRSGRPWAVPASRLCGILPLTMLAWQDQTLAVLLVTLVLGVPLAIYDWLDRRPAAPARRALTLDGGIEVLTFPAGFHLPDTLPAPLVGHFVLDDAGTLAFVEHDGAAPRLLTPAEIAALRTRLGARRA